MVKLGPWEMDYVLDPFNIPKSMTKINDRYIISKNRIIKCKSVKRALGGMENVQKLKCWLWKNSSYSPSGKYKCVKMNKNCKDLKKIECSQADLCVILFWINYNYSCFYERCLVITIILNIINLFHPCITILKLLKLINLRY